MSSCNDSSTNSIISGCNDIMVGNCDCEGNILDDCSICNGTPTSLNECSSITGTYNLTGTIE